MKCNIPHFIFVYTKIHSSGENGSDTAGRLIFHMEQNPNILCQRITDLLAASHSFYRKFNMICHRKKYASVNLSEHLLSFIQHFTCNLQAFRIDFLYHLSDIPPFRGCLQRIDRSIITRIKSLRYLFSESDTFSHNKVFLLIICPNSNYCVMIQHFFNPVHTFPHSSFLYS